MKEKAQDFVYLDTKRYISIDDLRTLYWAILIFPISMIVASVVSIKFTGLHWKSLFPMISYGIWSLFYWLLVCKIQSKKTKNTFALRFLVNGLTGLLISSLFWIFCSSISLTADSPFLEFDLCLWILLFYLIFSTVYILAIIFGVHKGLFSRIKKRNKTKITLTLSAFFGAILPVSGIIGIQISKSVRTHMSIEGQHWVITILACLMIFLPALAHINFLQYYYCKKYGIDCDEDGNTTSPSLERKTKGPEHRKEKPKKKPFPLFLKILIGILSIPVAFFVILFIIGFIKSIIEIT